MVDGAGGLEGESGWWQVGSALGCHTTHLQGIQGFQNLIRLSSITLCSLHQCFCSYLILNLWYGIVHLWWFILIKVYVSFMFLQSAVQDKSRHLVNKQLLGVDMHWACQRVSFESFLFGVTDSLVHKRLAYQLSIKEREMQAMTSKVINENVYINHGFLPSEREPIICGSHSPLRVKDHMQGRRVIDLKTEAGWNPY